MCAQVGWLIIEKMLVKDKSKNWQKNLRLAGCGPGCRLGDEAVVDEDQRRHWGEQCAGQILTITITNIIQYNIITNINQRCHWREQCAGHILSNVVILILLLIIG